MKRCLDIFFAITFLLCFWWVYVIISILVGRKLGSPVIFSQERPGLHGKVFKMYKFRSMTDEKDENGVLLPDDKRLTSFGKLLRSTSLDEIPEFINILKGDMSLVGPRPLLVKYLPRYTVEQNRRHELKPGVTGWAQVNGRNAISWEEKFRLDVEYVEKCSFILDIKIILLTIKKVFFRNDISQNGKATMEEFMGSDQ